MTTVQARWETGLRATFTAMGSAPAPVSIRLFGTRGFRELRLEDTYFAFKSSLQTFVDIIRGRIAPIRYEETMRIVELIERGMPSEGPATAASPTAASPAIAAAEEGRR